MLDWENLSAMIEGLISGQRPNQALDAVNRPKRVGGEALVWATRTTN